MEITKSVFERVLYVATSAHMEVFDSVQPYIEEAVARFDDEVMGGVETTEEQTLAAARAYVCLDAFLHVFRQLDLVLTPTGFGVVANQTTSPASKERVNALEAQLLLERERRAGRLMHLLAKVNGWGDTLAATHCIRTLYFDIRFYERAAGKAVDYEAWRTAQLPIMETDIMLRRKISDAQMETLLSAVRHAAITTEQTGAISLITDIMSLAIAHSPLMKERVHNLINYMEQDSTAFADYFNSQAYKLNHHDNFENQKDSPAFFFVG